MRAPSPVTIPALTFWAPTIGLRDRGPIAGFLGAAQWLEIWVAETPVKFVTHRCVPSKAMPKGLLNP